MQFDIFLNQCQAKSTSRLLQTLRMVGLIKGIENVRNLIFRNTLSAVGNRYPELFFFIYPSYPVDANSYFTLIRSKFKGIGNEVEHDLLQLFCINRNIQYFLSRDKPEADFFTLCYVVEQKSNLLDKRN